MSNEVVKRLPMVASKSDARLINLGGVAAVEVNHSSLSMEEEIEIAAYIMRAGNSFPDLLAALKESGRLVELMGNYLDPQTQGDKRTALRVEIAGITTRIDAAISKAEPPAAAQR